MFKLAKIENGRINVGEPEYLAVNADVKAGQALYLDGGVLKLATGTTKPTHIAGATASANSTIPALRIEANQIYRVPISGAPISNITVPGAKVTIGTDSDSVIAYTTTKDETNQETHTAITNGVATIVSLGEATKADDHILVRFE